MTVKTETPKTPAKKVTARAARKPGKAAADPNAWLVPASAEDDPPGTHAKWGPLPADRRGFSILSKSGRARDAATAGQALSPGAVWSRTLDLIIENPANGKVVRAHPVDIGAGSDSILPVIGLYPQTRKDLGLTGGAFKVVIARADGGGLRPARGVQVTAGFSLSSGEITVNTVQPYEFNRGDQGQPENSYDCTARLADEVGWFRWVQLNTLFFVSDEELRAGAVALKITGDEDWLLKAPAWEWSPNRATNTVTLTVAATRWGVEIGAVVEISLGTPVDGRYIVSETHAGWVNPEMQVVLERPAPKKLEPAPDVGTSTVDSGVATTYIGAGAPSAARMLSFASAAAGARISYSSAVQRSGLLVGFRSDCSGFVDWVLAQGGINVGQATTVDLPRKLQPGPGQQVTVWNRPLAGQAGHAVINILGSWFESGGRSSGGVHAMTLADVAAELGTSSLGSRQTPNGFAPLHPAGL